MVAKPMPGEALDLPYRTLRTTLLSYLRKQVKDASVAEDLLQEVFLKALAASRHGEAPKKLTAWLYAIARNVVIDFYRAQRPTASLPDDLAAEAEGDDLALQSLSECLLPFTRQLPAIYRDTLLATDFQGQTMQSLASAWSTSLSAVS